MKRHVLAAMLATCLFAAAPGAGMDNPHVSTLPDGSTDGSKCAFCHDDSLSLSRSHADTCTLCHREALHSGALEHSRASAAQVARAIGEKEAATLPLAADGRMYCGTCHLYHDPALMGESLLDEGRAKRDTPLNRGVRDSIVARGRRDGVISGEGEVEFREIGTRYLRLPGDALCRHCHEGH